MNKHELGFDRKHSDQTKVKSVTTHNIGFMNFFWKAAAWFAGVGAFTILGLMAISCSINACGV